MATRDVVVRIRAEVGAFKKDMDAAASKAKETAKKTEEAGKTAESGIGRLAQTAQQHEKAWNQTANGMVADGAAIVGVLGLSAKAAMDWESAWTGVKKTVDGTPAQLAQVETGLRGLAKTLPSTHAEIAGVAEAAGQLGVARDDVVGFTKTMIDLGESTNLTAEDAATNIAQISNVMGTMKREGTEGVERFGAALVALGNDGASTEAEILSMAQRIAGAGATLGATESDVLALSNTLASMGVRAELGGGVTTRVLLKMRSAVDEGGDSLQAFADVAGVSMDEFAAKFRSAPVEALDLVSKGIYRVNEAGGNVTSTLKDMGIKGTEETQVMLALANSGDMLADSLKLGADAWRENTALVDEANKRYETASSKVKIAWNNITDSAIDAGAVLLPVIAGVAEAVAELASWFGDLPAPVQSAMTMLGAVAGVSLLAGGAFMKLVPMVTNTIVGLKGLDAALGGGIIPGFGKASREARRTATDVASFGKKASAAQLAAAGLRGGLIGAAIGFGVLTTAVALHNRGLEAAKGPGHYVLELQKIGDEVSNVDSLFKNLDFGDSTAFEGKINGIGDALKELNRGGLDHWGADLGARNGIAILRENVEGLDQALATAASSGHAEDAAKAWDQITAAADDQGMSVEKLESLFPEYVDALKSAEAASNDAGGGLDALAGEFDVTSDAAKKAADAIDDFYKNLVDKGMVVLGERESLRALEESFDAAAEAAKENGKNLDINTEKGRANQAALDGIASSTLRTMEAQRSAGRTTAEMAATIAQGREAFIKNAVAMGMSEKAAAKLADQINLIPGAVYMKFDSNTADFGAKLHEIHELIKSTPDGSVTIEENSPEVIKALKDLGFTVTTLPDGRIKVTDNGTAKVMGDKIDKVAEKHRTATINANAETGTAERELNNTARNRSSLITQTVARTIKESLVRQPTKVENLFVPRKELGGRAPGLAGGGRVPETGLGTDMVMGVNALGLPHVRVDDREWVINRKSSDKHDLLLGMINRDDPRVDMMKQLVGLAGGGRVGAAEKRVKELQRSYSRISGDKKNRSRKLAAKDRLDDAKDELKAAKEAEKRSKAAQKKAEEARKAAREKAERVGELRFDLRRDLRRGEITDAFTSGSGMSVVDRLFEQSKNKDLSKGTRSRLRSTAYGMEGQLLRLEKRSDKLAQSLEKATKQRDDLLSARNAVRDQMTGAFDLGSLTGQKDEWGYGQGAGKKGLLAYGRSMAAGAKKLSGKVSKLQKLGFTESMIQQVIDEWTGAGTFELADAMLSMNKSERTSFVGSFKTVERYGLNTGTSLTKTMSRGGIDAAEGLVDGLESKTKDVENAFYKLGKDAERSFKRALGIKSPSKVMKAAGINVGEGAELGILSKVGDVSKAAEQLMAPPALMVPPSPEVARYASAQATAPSVAIDYDRLAEAMTRVQLRPVVAVGKNTAADIVEVGSKQAARRQ